MNDRNDFLSMRAEMKEVADAEEVLRRFAPQLAAALNAAMRLLYECSRTADFETIRKKYPNDWRTACEAHGRLEELESL